MMKLAKLYFHTLRYLGPKRLLNQLTYRLRRGILRLTGPVSSPIADAPRISPQISFLPSPQDNTADLLSGGKWQFLSESKALGFPPDWDVKAPALWEYNLQYFQYLALVDFDRAKKLIDDWIRAYTYAPRRKGWDPYTTSLRLRCWLKHFWFPFRDQIESDGGFKDRFLASLGSQLDALARQLEINLGANHLLENLITFQFFRYAFPHTSLAAEGARTESMFYAEMAEQTLSDGGNYERSPMYHCIMLHHLLDLWNVMPLAARTAPIGEMLRAHLEKMLNFMALITHPDGEISLFNDAAIGIAPAPGDIQRYAAAMGLSPCGTISYNAPSTGYYTGRHGNSYIAVDMAAIGPDYLPGHAHADFGSFELSLDGHRLITDGGTGTYAVGPRREWLRSTAAHNTVEIDSQSQCECWKSFRVARRYYPREVRFQGQPGGFILSGQHDGYARLPGSPIHKREFHWFNEGALVIKDEVRGGASLPSMGRIHFAPGSAVKVNGLSFTVLHNGMSYEGWLRGASRLSLDESFYSPRFGVWEKRPCLAYSLVPDGCALFFIGKSVLPAPVKEAVSRLVD